MNTIEIEKLSKSFGKSKVIDNISFSVPQHSVFGFLGQNGAGKTTTMKMILGLLKPDEGNIKVLGETVSYGETKTNRYIGYLPDVPEFYGYMKPIEYLKLCGEITGLNDTKIKLRSKELLELVGLSDIHKRIGSFSRGMKQRLGIAQALLNEPQLLICDEPTSALDPIGRKEILDILEQVKGKTTVIFSTHILSDVERICDRIAVLNKGKLVLSGTIEEIKEKHKTNSLLIEFANKIEFEQFIALPDLKQIIKNSEISGDSVVIHSNEIKNIEQKIIECLHSNSMLPVKLEVLEPTIESLFMEVVK
ncbi:MAG: ABC transporter ATP-binding protein [Bacillota bacterium]|nr:ABC transporter ATP-binding protein [Bacillota bacterium]